jgi:NhaP-type Na+/H+ or K+/H+ antiporter
METSPFYNPGLTIALALAMGMIAQALAHHLRIPGIVLMLTAGVVFGPDGLGVIRPDALGPALNILTGFAVAVILFEGGMNLKMSRLRHAQDSIRQLIVFGGLVTTAGAAAATHLIMAWPWRNAILFGTLVMVTGPTVIQPLLKRLKVKRSVATVLEAEGVLIDALGAVVAMVALEAALSPAHASPMMWVWHVVSRLGFGALAGWATALLLIALFRVRCSIPEGTEKVFALAIILALFQGTNTLVAESGIVAVTVAGLVIGNCSTYVLRDLVEFKEELTVLLIGMLFVLLAADVRISQVTDLGLPGLFVVLTLMVLVRPAAVFAGTWRSTLAWRERLFIAWIGPRGIVAAAVASFFAASFADKGLPGGLELRALVFLVITITVVSAGLTGGLAANALGVRRPSQMGWVILGACALARGLARLFKEDGQEVVCIDSNADHCRAAEEDCTRVLYGSGLKKRLLLRAEIDIRRGALALTANDEVNYLFIQKVKEEVKEIELYAALQPPAETLNARMFHQQGAELLFGRTVDVELWNRRFADKQVRLQYWQCAAMPAADGSRGWSPYSEATGGLLAAAIRRNNGLLPFSDRTTLKKDDVVSFFVHGPEMETIAALLTSRGWRLLDSPDDTYFSTSSCHLPRTGKGATGTSR